MSTISTSTELKDVGNAAYNAAIVAGLTAASRYLTKAAGLKDRPIEFKLKSLGMLTLDIGFSMYLYKKLRDSKTLPENIF